MKKNLFHESKKEIQAYRVSSIATRPFHCEVIKATSINSLPPSDRQGKDGSNNPWEWLKTESART